MGPQSYKSDHAKIVYFKMIGTVLHNSSTLNISGKHSANIFRNGLWWTDTASRIMAAFLFFIT